jgi:hypothetical protein
MRNFSYSRNEQQTSLEASGGITELAAEVGYMTRAIYSALSRNDPMAAALFRASVMIAIAAPDTPTWTVTAQSENGTEILFPVPRDTGK